MNQIFDAIIIGAGIIESATSLALGRKGWRVLNIDKLSPEAMLPPLVPAP